MGALPQKTGNTAGHQRRRTLSFAPRGASGSGGPAGERNGNTSRGADQGRDCGAAEIQRIAENAPRGPDMNTPVVLQPFLNMAVEPLAMCYPGLAGGTLRAG